MRHKDCLTLYLTSANSTCFIHELSMIYIDQNIQLGTHEVQISAIRAQGAGGQNVNKVSSAIQLRFDIPHSSLPRYIKEALLKSHDKRISQHGVLILKSQEHRTQLANKEAALERLIALIQQASIRPRRRIATKPSKGAHMRRMDNKSKRGQLKSQRRKTGFDDY